MIFPKLTSIGLRMMPCVPSFGITSVKRVSCVSFSPMRPADENDLENKSLDFRFWSFSWSFASWFSIYFLTFSVVSIFFKSFSLIIFFTVLTVATSDVFSATVWNIFYCFCLICKACIFSYYSPLLIFFLSGLSYP